MVSRIASKAIDWIAVAALLSLIYAVAELPLRLAEYRMMGGD
jgi:hypothetical protein